MDATVIYLLVLLDFNPVYVNTETVPAPEIVEFFDTGEKCYEEAMNKTFAYNIEYAERMNKEEYMIIENRIFTCVPMIADVKNEVFPETLSYDGDTIDGQNPKEILRSYLGEY